MDDVVAHLEIAKIRKERFGDRAVPVAAPFDLRALFFEDIGLGDDLHLRGGKPEAFGKLTHRDEDGHVEQLIGAIHENAAKVVLRQQLHRAFRAPFGGGHEQDRVPPLAHAPDFRNPLLNAPAKLHCRLTGDIQYVVSAFGRALEGPLVYRQLFEFRGALEARRQIVPRDEHFVRRRHGAVLRPRSFIARRQLRLEIPHLGHDFLVLGEDERQVAAAGVVEERKNGV